MGRRPNTLDELRVELRSRGLRATPMRLLISQLIAASERVLSVPEIIGRLPRDADRATVFRTLRVFTAVQLLRQVDVGDRTYRYKWAARATGTEANFVCTACGEVRELIGVELRGRTARPQSLATRAVEVIVQGRCDRCSRRAVAPS